MSGRQDIVDRLPAALRAGVDSCTPALGGGDLVNCSRAALRDICRWLHQQAGYQFASLVVEETEAPSWSLSYVFFGPERGDLVTLTFEQGIDDNTVPTISDITYAADWHEREAEDLFGLSFEDHPMLGEFVLHEDWPDGANPMRKAFDAGARGEPRTDLLWQPPMVVEAPGVFAMPVGPVFSDFAESAHFLLETVGEEIITSIPRFFYKYRGVEKIAEGRSAANALLLAERFSGTSAFAHGLAFCQAVEAISGVTPPPRAARLRVLLAELERLRHHTAAIGGICQSTALAVAASQAGLIEEDLLRLTGAASGHRYLFGLLKAGGLTRDFTDDACRRLAVAARDSLARLGELERLLDYTSSFLDRLEEVGMISERQATAYGLVGPVARASGVARDVRKIAPYAAYQDFDFEVPSEREGDGYARLRVLFREAAQSVALIAQAAADLPSGPVCAALEVRQGCALGVAETPIGAAFHWLRLGPDGVVARYRISPPSFANWHGFHLAVENFAFQDFPIIMASFGLSNAESDR